MLRWRHAVEGRAPLIGDEARDAMAKELVSRVRAKMGTRRSGDRGVLTAAMTKGDALVVAQRSKVAPDEIDVWDAVIRRAGEDEPRAGEPAPVPVAEDLSDTEKKPQPSVRQLPLKTWPEPFEALVRDEKVHEVRKDDRGYRVGDVLVLREWKPCPCRGAGWTRQGCELCAEAGGAFTGRSEKREVTHVTKGGTFGLPPDLCVMSVRRVERGTP